MGLLNKTSWKFLGIFVAIVAGSIAIAYTAAYFSPDARQQHAISELAEQEQEQEEVIQNENQ